METLKRTLREAPVVERGEYDYFVHPITDGLPLVEPSLLREVVAGVKDLTSMDRVEKIVTPEAMGIHITTALSLDTDTPFVIVRKRPYGFAGEVAVHQTTGYAEGELYLNSVGTDDRVLLLDDVLATGGTLSAVCAAIEQTGAELVDVVTVIRRETGEVPELPVTPKSLVTVDVVDGRVVVHE